MKGRGMRALFGEVVVLGLLGVVCAGLSYALHPGRPFLYLDDEPLGEWEVSMERIEERWGIDDVFWIDARMRDAYESGHVEGALFLNEQEWDELLYGGAAEVIFESADRPFVVYCGSHGCQASKKVATRMREEMGVPEVYVFRGGWRKLRDSAAGRLKFAGSAVGG